ncbi:hypothetical protein RIF29_30248 [Crotalaria pallida]|uniref:Isopenicillin N synthase-like Fe(2+) 2OG dioxygenase domain-containing protein n=1 Tax=Crotalaria pallida TaxID=3830 RepID=A0AAN9EMU4_CROPI
MGVKENNEHVFAKEEVPKYVETMEVPSVQELVKKDPLQVPIIDFALLSDGDKEELSKLDIACKEWGGFKIWSNGKYKSSEHRAVINKNKERTSHVISMSPVYEVEVEPLDNMVDEQNPKLYKKVRYGDYLELSFNHKIRGKSHVELVSASMHRYVDCNSQVERWNSGVYKSFASRTLAENAWEEYLNNGKNNVGWSSIYMGYKCYYDMVEETEGVAFAENRDIENQLYDFSMQDTLARISQLHTKLFPAYTKHSVMAQGGKNYVRYYVSVPSKLIGRPPVTMGRFAETEYLAREDAALIMLRRLMAYIGKKVVDFNYHNTEIAQQHISNLENLPRRFVATCLNTELDTITLRGKNGHGNAVEKGNIITVEIEDDGDDEWEEEE